MADFTVNFAGGVNADPGFGDEYIIGFAGTWAFSDGWQILLATSAGDQTLGFGNLFFNNSGSLLMDAQFGMTYKNRVYINLERKWAFSANDPDVTGFEEQNPGAGTIDWLSQYGTQDVAVSFAVTQGRVIVFGRKSIQIWQVDADPANFQLIQTLDNTGTMAKLSPQQLGDFDVLYLDDTGVRSVRSKEVTLNAYIDDIGAPIDSFVQAVLAGYDASASCGVVEPTTKNFWLFIKDTIYVLSRHPSSKITAWSTWEPRGSDNVLFVPQKFVVKDGLVYMRSVARGHYVYGGSNNSTYDATSQVTFITPYMNDKKAGTKKSIAALSAVLEGRWALYLSADPVSNNFVNFYTNTQGNAASPNVLVDSTYDLGFIEAPLVGTHFSLKGVSANTSTSLPAICGSILLYYNTSEVTG